MATLTTDQWVAAGAAEGTTDAGSTGTAPALGASDPSPTGGAPAPAAESDPTRAAPQSGAGAAPVAATPAEIEALDALLDAEGKQKLSIPLTARIPWKQNGQEGFSTLKEIQEAHLFHRDYTQRSQSLAQARKEFERQQRDAELRVAELDAREKIIQEQLERYKTAMADPEAAAKMAADQDRMRSDPEFKRLYDDAMAKRMADARTERETGLAQFEESQTIADDAADYITRSAAQYPGVDPNEVRQYFADALQSGRMDIGPGPDQFNARTVDRVFGEHASRLKSLEDRFTAPLRTKLDEVTKRLEAMEAAKRNGDVVAGLRATGTPTNGAPPLPTSAAPPAGSRLPEPAPGETITDRTRLWARRR